MNSVTEIKAPWTPGELEYFDEQMTLGSRHRTLSLACMARGDLDLAKIHQEMGAQRYRNAHLLRYTITHPLQYAPPADHLVTCTKCLSQAMRSQARGWELHRPGKEVCSECMVQLIDAALDSMRRYLQTPAGQVQLARELAGAEEDEG